MFQPPHCDALFPGIETPCDPVPPAPPPPPPSSERRYTRCDSVLIGFPRLTACLAPDQRKWRGRNFTRARCVWRHRRRSARCLCLGKLASVANCQLHISNLSRMPTRDRLTTPQPEALLHRATIPNTDVDHCLDSAKAPIGYWGLGTLMLPQRGPADKICIHGAGWHGWLACTLHVDTAVYT